MAQIPESGIELKPTSPTKKSSKKWILVGAGAVAVGGGVIAALVGRGTSTTQKNEKLPDPPGGPTGN